MMRSVHPQVSSELATPRRPPRNSLGWAKTCEDTAATRAPLLGALATQRSNLLWDPALAV